MRKFYKQGMTPVRRDRVTGQGMTEYIIIVALIAIASIAAVGVFGAGVQGQFTTMAGAIVGKKTDSGIAKAAEAATALDGKTTDQIKLDTYAN